MIALIIISWVEFLRGIDGQICPALEIQIGFQLNH